MRTLLSVILAAAIFLPGCAGGPERPPLAPVKVVAEDYWGKTVNDPYRYLEDLKDTVVQNWIKSQADFARATIDRIPGRQGLIDKMREFDGRRAARVTNLAITDNDQYFYLKTTPADETGKLFHRTGFEGTESLLFDPTTFGSDTTKKYVISNISPSDDGGKIAIEVAPNGSESSIMLIMDVEGKTLSPEQIDRCWLGGASWLEDGKRFLYNRLRSSDVHDPDREKDSKSYLHVVGTDPSQDVEVFSRAKYPGLGIKPEDFPIVAYDKYSRYIFGILATVDRRLNAYYAPASELGKERIAWKRLFDPKDEIQNFYPTDKDLYLYTAKGAPNFHLLKTSLTAPNIARAEEVIPEDPGAKLNSVILTKAGLFYTLTRNGVKSEVYALPYGQKGPGRALQLPIPAGSANLSSKGFKFDDLWVGISGWTTDSRRYRYTAATGEFKREQLTTPAEFPEYDDLVVEEVMVPSHDGVEVPLSIVYKKGVVRDGTTPTFIFGYGAYGISINPFFSPSFMLWTYHGGVFAVAHVRGGGELGEKWHMEGFKTTKPNTWKDLIACAEYLVSKKYTDPRKIVINGGSAGGILIGRAMTERPDLFAAAIPEVGMMNALRSENTPNGPVNAPEFGTVKDSAECMALMEMDAYLHVKDGAKYPATLITAGMNDPRVIAWQPAKFAARLEAANGSDKPVLFLVDYAAGHGIGDTKSKQFENLADALSFGFWQTGHRDFQP